MYFSFRIKVYVQIINPNFHGPRPGYALLKERELKLPYDLVVHGAPYLGPPLDVAEDLC